MNVLVIGDITGKPGRQAVKELLPGLVAEERVSLVIANGENAAAGSGITPAIAGELHGYGVQVITTGDHVWQRKEMMPYLEKGTDVLRPANYPDAAPGKGYGIYTSTDGVSVGVIDLLGRVFLQPADCPFRKGMQLVERLKAEGVSVIMIDFHAEATSEKVALGWYLDGMISCLYGTHTHIQTADERVLPKGTAYITDIGMTGPHDSVIGRKIEQILTRFIVQVPSRFEVAEGNVQLNGALIDIDERTGHARSIRRVRRALGKAVSGIE